MLRKLITFFIFPVFLAVITSSLFLEEIIKLGVRELQLPGYFYLPLDWKKKNIFAASDKKNATYFLGSSRTAYSVNPEIIKTFNAINLGLIASSYFEQEILVREVLTKGSQNFNVWIELNPMGLTKRHMNAASVAVGSGLIKNYYWYDFNFLKDFEIWFFQNHYIVQDLIKSILELKFENKLSGFELERQNRFKHEHKIISKKDYNGFIGSELSFSARFKPDYLRECLTMLRWSFSDSNDDLKLGLSIFDKMIESIKLHKSKIVFWVPPETESYNLVSEKHKLQFINYVRTKYPDIPIIDIAKLLNRKSDQHFLDCIHPSREGATKISNHLNSLVLR